MDYLALKKMKIKYKFSAKISMKRQRNCGFKMQFLGVELDPFMTLKVHFDHVFQCLCLPLRVWGEHVFIFSAESSAGCWPICFCGFGPLYVAKFSF